MKVVPNTRGILLVASVMLLIFVSIVVVGTTVFIAQRLREVNAKRIRTSCINLAQAGINQAIYTFRLRDLTGTGSFPLGQTNIDANNFFILSAVPANLLMVNTATAAFGASGAARRDLLNLTIKNSTSSGAPAVTIDRMIVSWVKPAPARNLRRIRIRGAVVWSGNLATPANADIPNPNFTLNAAVSPTSYPINELRFSGSMAGTTSVTIQFVMTDGSTKRVTAFPASQNYNFQVTAQGQTTGSNILRTVQAEYNAITAKVVNYSEQ